MRKLFYLLPIILIFTSCSTKIYQSSSSAIANISITTLPIEADLIVDKSKTLQATSVTTVVFGIFKTGDVKYADVNIPGSVGSLEKQAAIYKALENTDFDIIVNPKYLIEIERGLFVKTTTATVSGYGAKIKLR